MHNLTRDPDRLEALASAFVETDYLVEAPAGTISVRIGATAPLLDRQLAGRPWAIITAHNPDGCRRSRHHNAAAHAKLQRELTGMKPDVVLPACNRDRAGQWPDEVGWLFTPASMAQTDALARKYGQRAIVTGTAGRKAMLRIYCASDRGDHAHHRAPLSEFIQVVAA